MRLLRLALFTCHVFSFHDIVLNRREFLEEWCLQKFEEVLPSCVGHRYSVM